MIDGLKTDLRDKTARVNELEVGLNLFSFEVNVTIPKGKSRVMNIHFEMTLLLRFSRTESGKW